MDREEERKWWDLNPSLLPWQRVAADVRGIFLFFERESTASRRVAASVAATKENLVEVKKKIINFFLIFFKLAFVASRLCESTAAAARLEGVRGVAVFMRQVEKEN